MYGFKICFLFLNRNAGYHRIIGTGTVAEPEILDMGMSAEIT